MGIASVLDKAGPALATGIVLALLTGAATAVMAWRDLASASAVRFGNIATELERPRADLDGFRAPGGRFTAHDGDRHWQRMDALDDRLRQQEQRPPRLNPETLHLIGMDPDDLVPLREGMARTVEYFRGLS